MTKTKLGRNFGWLNTTQFFGALNDNFSKQVLIIALTAGVGLQLEQAVARTTLIFAIPFLLFLPASGIIADRFSKSRVIVWAKWLELGTMLLNFGALLSIAVAPQLASTLLLIVLFLMCTQSTIFSPAKYGVIREMVGESSLSRANGLIQAFTFLAIIAGIVVAPALSRFGREAGFQFQALGIGSLVFACFGLMASMRIQRTQAMGTSERISILFVRDIWVTMRSVRHDRYLTGAVFAAAFFLMMAAFLQGYFLVYGQTYLFPPGESLASKSGSMENCLYIFVAAAFGIGLGAWLAGALSPHHIEFGIVPIGGGLLSAGFLMLALIPPSVPLAVGALFVAGLGGGMFIVPLEAFIQHRSPPDRVGQLLAASSWIGWVGIAVSAGVIQLFTMLSLSPRTGFLAVGLASIVMALVTLWVLPDFLFRFIVLLITRTIYRIRTTGLENVPQDGGALLVCNHVSWIDAIVIIATQQRRVRFMMSKAMLKKYRWMAFFGRLMHVIPVVKGDGREGLNKSIADARQALDEGFLVCIFAEGHLTRNGMMFSFKRGLERILEGSNHPVIPMYIGGAWGSVTSYAHGRLFSRWPLKLPYPVSLFYGEPLPSSSTAGEVRQAVMELSCEYFEEKKSGRKPLPWYFIRMARKIPRCQVMYDSMTRKSMTYRETLIACVALAPKLQREVSGELVGVLLPPSIGGALVNISLTMLGKTPVNLNPTAGTESVTSALDQCEITTVITAKKLLDRFPDLKLPGQILFAEDLVGSISTADKIKAAIKATIYPKGTLCNLRRFSPDDLCTVIFSSGSTGTPKGVMLSHHNIFSNVEALSDLLQPEHTDSICCSLPLFHSFGFTVGIWFPVTTGFRVAYHANPLETAKIAALIEKDQSSIYITTPTFLQTFMRKASPENLKSLRLCLVGAEKLKRPVAEAFEEKFGIQPLEGYGATECSPVVSVNVPDVHIEGVRQVGQKPGTIGQAIPGVAVRVVDPDSGERLPVGASGRLLIRGPNVMLGYLGLPEKSAEVLKDGWYDSGDMAKVDADGFLTITDRLSRFSKIGGEMVPHIGLEEKMFELLNVSEPVLAVTSLPDERKGEKLVVLYTEAIGDLADLQERVARSDLPNLWKPAPRNYCPVDAIPILATGKVNLRALKEMANAALQ